MNHAQRAVELASTLAQSHLARANALLALGHNEDALSALKSALRCDPQNACLEMETGDVCLRNLDRPAEAIEHYRKAGQIDSGFAPAFVRLADLHLQLGDVCATASALLDLERRSRREADRRSC